MTALMKVLRVLHLASFRGNIGDLANHAGARHLLGEGLGFTLEFTELEIREFYWKKRAFDDAFIDYANTFDLMIIGGGNYFELWVEQSATGTSIDITVQRLGRLTVPTVFFALGVDTGQGYSQQSVQRFSAFINTVLECPHMFVCVRNDGSHLALREVLGDKVAEQILIMPDGGFFADANNLSPAIDSGYLGINLAGDMLERRFSRDLSVDGFLREFAMSLQVLMDARIDLHINFMPHIWRDCALVAQLLPHFSDVHLRSRVVIGSLNPTRAGLATFLESYRNCDLVLGTRFHANVCPMGMMVPTRGLLNYPQVSHLYEELGLQHRLIDIRKSGFANSLVDGVLSDLNDLGTQRKIYSNLIVTLHDQAVKTLGELRSWLNNNLK